MQIITSRYIIRPVSPVALNQCQLQYDSDLDQLIPVNHSEAALFWKQINQDRVSRNLPLLQDLPLFRPGDLQSSGNNLRIRCGLTSYQVITFYSAPCEQWTDARLGAGLAIVPVCADGHILIGRRAALVHHCQGLFHVAAGHAHPKPDFKNKSDTLMDAVLEELEEEMAIRIEDIRTLEFLGLGLNLQTSKTAFLTRILLRENAAWYLERWQDLFHNQTDREFDEVTTLQKIIGQDSLENCHQQFTIACQMALHIDENLKQDKSANFKY